MGFLSAVAQFGAHPVLNRVLGIEKSLEAVRVAHLVLQRDSAKDVQPEAGLHYRDAARFEREQSAMDGTGQSRMVSAASGFSTTAAAFGMLGTEAVV